LAIAASEADQRRGDATPQREHLEKLTHLGG
jgi:hypothetical protein